MADEEIRVRLSASLKGALKDRARANHRSMSSEVAVLIEAAIKSTNAEELRENR